MQSKPVCVLGAGLMGVGIATHFARYGHDIWLYDTDSSRIAEISAVASGILHELITAEQFAADERTGCESSARYDFATGDCCVRVTD